MTVTANPTHYASLDLGGSIWDEFSTIAPLVLVGTIEADGSPDIAPKHQAMPLGSGAHFGFVCRHDHATYRNAVATESFSVGYPSPDMVLQTSLAAAPRDSAGAKPTLEVLSLSPARVIDGVLVDGCRVQLECRLERILDELDDSALLVGRVVAAYASPAAMAEQTTLLAYVHPGRVAAVHETKPFPYHRGFHR